MSKENKRGKLILAFLVSNNIIGKDLEAQRIFRKEGRKEGRKKGRKEISKQVSKQISKRGKNRRRNREN
jgi:hypothetical protein